MNQNGQTMGIWGIPGTFPTGVVLEAIKKSDPDERVSKWTRDKVNDVYYWYKEGIKQGHEPWTNENRQIANFITEHTKFSLSDTNLFGWTLETLAKSGKIKNEFYTIDIPSTAKINLLPNSDTLEKYANSIKWVAIAGIMGVVVYFTWPILMKGRKTLKKRMN